MHVLLTSTAVWEEGAMRFSAWFAAESNPWDEILEEARFCEKIGYEGVWIADHFMRPGDDYGPWIECWTTLAALAALVPRVRVGSIVTGNTFRNPAILAKQVAQVDVISGGRVVLGIGAAWQEREHNAFGIPFPTIGGRHRMLTESVQILRSLFDGKRTDFDGKYYTMRDAFLSPPPVQEHLPIMIGGGGEKVMLGIVARFADAWNIGGTPEMLAQKSNVLDEHCERVGRDPASIWRTATANVIISDDAAEVAEARARRGWNIIGSAREVTEEVGKYIDAKVSELILLNHGWGTGKEAHKERFQRFIEDVAPAFR